MSTEIMTLRRAEFTADHVHACQPILITDGLTDWPAQERWSPSTLRSLAGDTLVDLQVSRSGVWGWKPDGSVAHPDDQSTMSGVPFSRAADLIMAADVSGPKYYVPQVSIGLKFPELLSDLCFPACDTRPFNLWYSFPKFRVTTNLWFGSAGTITSLHFDLSNNLFAQVYGSKTLTLFNPEQDPFLYRHPKGSTMAHASFVDVDKPDLAAFPLYRHARPIRVTVKPGQMLFMPAFWWHHVKSESISISVNQWFAPGLHQMVGPYAWWLLQSEFKRERFARARDSLDSSPEGLLHLAVLQLEVQAPVAVLAASVAVDEYITRYFAGSAVDAHILTLKARIDRLVESALADDAFVLELSERLSLLTTLRELLAVHPYTSDRSLTGSPGFSALPGADRAETSHPFLALR